MPGQALSGPPGDHRPRVLPREVGGGSCRDRRHPGGNCEDAHVLCAQEALRASQGARNRSRLAMNAMKQQAPERQEIEELLPWHAAGTLSRRDAQRVEEALANDPELARRYAMVRDEFGETIHLNETLGAPSARALEQLFAKIDAEPARAQMPTLNLGGRIAEFFAGLSPRTLAWSASAAAIAILLQAGLLADIMLRETKTAGYQTASAPTTDPGVGAFTLIRFAPQASSDDITKFLEANKLSIAAGPMAGGLYKVRVAVTGIPKGELANIVKKLQQDKVVGFIATTE